MTLKRVMIDEVTGTLEFLPDTAGSGDATVVHTPVNYVLPSEPHDSANTHLKGIDDRLGDIDESIVAFINVTEDLQNQIDELDGDAIQLGDLEDVEINSNVNRQQLFYDITVNRWVARVADHSDVPSLPASKIGSGVLDPARLGGSSYTPTDVLTPLGWAEMSAEKGNVGQKGNKGDLGPQGIQGIQGIQGNTGPVGNKGDRGDVGPAGQKGNTGDQGTQGIQGIKGDVGPQGLTGPTGIKGDRGDQGIQGIKGDLGPTGLTGSKGDVGPQGIKGDIGPQGIQGIQGVQGIKGDVGPTGGIGPQGDIGLTGPTGNKGDVGPQGNTGPAGIKGDVGPQGTTGQKGNKGDIGPTGLTGPIGMTGSKGDLGPQGIKGDVGPQGIQGIKGSNGNTGPTGQKGDVGPQGIQGIKGSNGNTGPTGLTGPTGPKGDIGPAGTIRASLQEFAATIANWNDAVHNGWYVAADALNAPGAGWFIGIVTQHNAFYITQEVWAFANGVAVPKYRRQSTDGVWSAWTGDEIWDGQMTAGGASAGLGFQDRSNGSLWQWYSQGNVGHLWRAGYGNRLSIDNAGNFTATGTITDISGNVRRIPVFMVNYNHTIHGGNVNCSLEKTDTGSYTYTLPDIGAPGDAITFANSGVAGNITIARSGVALVRNNVDANITVGPGTITTIYRSAHNARWLA